MFNRVLHLSSCLKDSVKPSLCFAAFVCDEDLQVVEVKNLDRLPKQKDEPLVERLPKCRERAKKLLETISPNDEEAKDEVLHDLNDCLKKGLAPTFQRGKDEISFQKKVSSLCDACGISCPYGNL